MPNGEVSGDSLAPVIILDATASSEGPEWEKLCHDATAALMQGQAVVIRNYPEDAGDPKAVDAEAISQFCSRGGKDANSVLEWQCGSERSFYVYHMLTAQHILQPLWPEQKSVTANGLESRRLVAKLYFWIDSRGVKTVSTFLTTLVRM